MTQRPAMRRRVHPHFRGVWMLFRQWLKHPLRTGAVTPVAGTDDLASCHVAGGQERRGPVTNVIVGAPLDLPAPHRPQRLAPIERLNLRFLIHAQHERPIRWGQYRPTMSQTLSTNRRSLES